MTEYTSITPMIKVKRFCDKLEKEDREGYRLLVEEIYRRENRSGGWRRKKKGGLFG